MQTKIRNIEKKDTENLNNLFIQLTGNKHTSFNFNLINKHKSSYFRVLENKNGEAIGFAALIIYPVPSVGMVGRVEDVIVDKTYRGEGLGKKLLKDLIKIAKKEKLKSINLTSNPKRGAARNLYKSLSFNIYKTGVFKLDLRN
jgi:ribosomal protein S18 acetylase RimI-like enzyme